MEHCVDMNKKTSKGFKTVLTKSLWI